MAETKTKPTEISAEDFIGSLADPARRDDARALAAMMERLSGEPPRMWGASIVGFGVYDYQYESGRRGSMARISFSPRSKEFVLYIMDGFAEYELLLQRLGKHKTGKSCLYIKKLADVDRAVLEDLVSASLAHMDERFPRES